MRPALDERAIGVGEPAVHDLLDHPVGEPARVEAILEPSGSVMVHGRVGHRGSTARVASIASRAISVASRFHVRSFGAS